MKKITAVVFLFLMSFVFCACKNEALEEKEAVYVQAQQLFQVGNYQDAETVFSSLGTYRDSKYMLTEIEMAQKYDNAVALLEAKNYAGAYAALCQLQGYKDVDQLLERFQTIILTEENWDQYYEIVEKLNTDSSVLEEDGFYRNLYVEYVFRMKEHIQECSYMPENNKIVISFQGTMETQEFFFDEATKTHRYGENKETVYKMNKTFKEKLEGSKEEKIIVSEKVEKETAQNRRIKEYYYCFQWKLFSATEVEGKLYLYIE